MIGSIEIKHIKARLGECVTCIFPAPALESVISPKSLGPFIGRMVLGTKSECCVCLLPKVSFLLTAGFMCGVLSI